MARITSTPSEDPIHTISDDASLDASFDASSTTSSETTRPHSSSVAAAPDPTVAQLTSEISAKDDEISFLRNSNREKDDEILFLRNSNRGLAAENDELVARNACLKDENSKITKEYSDFKKNHEKFKIDSEKEATRMKRKLETVDSVLEEMNADKENLLEPPAKKLYSELKSTQRTVVRKQISGTFGPKLNRFVRKRNLTVSYVIFDDEEGNHVRVNFKEHLTFDKLTPAGRESQNFGGNEDHSSNLQ